MADPVQVIHTIKKTWGGIVPENFGSGWKQLREKKEYKELSEIWAKVQKIKWKVKQNRNKLRCYNKKFPAY
jgi:hypothetical protein